MSHPSPGSADQRHFFRKDERLRSKIAFEYLFEHGSSFRIGVLKFFYIFDLPNKYINSPLSVAFSAPKRRYRHAVTRNYFKRRMREAFRLNKSNLKEELNKNGRNLVILMVFSGGSNTQYAQIEKSIVRALDRLSQKLSNDL